MKKKTPSETKRNADYDNARARREEKRTKADDDFFEALNHYRDALRAIENAYLAELDDADRRFERRRGGSR